MQTSQKADRISEFMNLGYVNSPEEFRSAFGNRVRIPAMILQDAKAISERVSLKVNRTKTFTYMPKCFVFLIFIQIFLQTVIRCYIDICFENQKTDRIEPLVRELFYAFQLSRMEPPLPPGTVKMCKGLGLAGDFPYFARYDREKANKPELYHILCGIGQMIQAATDVSAFKRELIHNIQEIKINELDSKSSLFERNYNIKLLF